MNSTKHRFPGMILWLLCLLLMSAGVHAAEPVSAETALQALREALRYADVTYEVDGTVEQGVAYRWGGRMSVDEYLQAVREGKRPGIDAGVDASALVVNAYRAADPGHRFRIVSGGAERLVADATSGVLYEWNVELVPYTSLRPGDLIFFQNEQGQVSGVAVFERLDGPNVHFVVASASSNKVIRTFANVNNAYWNTRVKATGRLLEMAP